MQVNIQKLTSTAIIPTYAHEGDAGADLYSIETIIIPPAQYLHGDSVDDNWWCTPQDLIPSPVLMSSSIRLIGTGLSLDIPIGYEGQIRSRSGMAIKFGVVVLNSPGTIDSGYKGEIKVALVNHSRTPYKVVAGDRIAQLVIAPVVSAKFTEVTQIGTDSQRGTGGFGSSGS